MTKLLTCAVLLGFTGGLLKSLCVLIGGLLYPHGHDIYSTFIGLFISQILFITPICLTKGVAEKSHSLLKKGAVIGIGTAVMTSGISLLLIFFKIRGAVLSQFWFNHILVNATLLGVSAGVICGFGNEATRRVYIFVGLSKLSFDIAILFDKLAIYPLEGAMQATIIWCCMAIAEKEVSE